ncbi:hypothetical protein [Vibrio mediterranei]|uniref:hypothetical protein n=1 Tax=Vibrio mediterranei TaxID=689 RepID=UPI00148E1B78|nr:hypothetical protein [Vibrio mediterranei]NOH31754.1 hypothetical protein [Vibrio mediterranei]
MKMEQWLTVLFKTQGLCKRSYLFSWALISLFLSESVVIAGEVNSSNVIVHTPPFEFGEFLTGITDATLSRYGFEEALLPKSNELNQNFTIRSGTFTY